MTWYPPKYYADMRKLARAQAAKLTSSQAHKPSSKRTQEPRPQAKGSSFTPKSTS